MSDNNSGFAWFLSCFIFLCTVETKILRRAWKFRFYEKRKRINIYKHKIAFIVFHVQQCRHCRNANEIRCTKCDLIHAINYSPTQIPNANTKEKMLNKFSCWIRSISLFLSFRLLFLFFSVFHFLFYFNDDSLLTRRFRGIFCLNCWTLCVIPKFMNYRWLQFALFCRILS